jgi:hypothetical protein
MFVARVLRRLPHRRAPRRHHPRYARRRREQRRRRRAFVQQSLQVRRRPARRHLAPPTARLAQRAHDDHRQCCHVAEELLENRRSRVSWGWDARNPRLCRERDGAQAGSQARARRAFMLFTIAVLSSALNSTTPRAAMPGGCVESEPQSKNALGERAGKAPQRRATPAVAKPRERPTVRAILKIERVHFAQGAVPADRASTAATPLFIRRVFPSFTSQSIIHL